MKKILSLVLILALSVCLFAGCGEDPNPTQTGATLEDAKTYLYAMYKEDDGTIARRDFSMVAAVMIDGVKFPVAWSTDAPDFVTIGAAENNMVKIDIVEEPAEQVTFKLIGTLTDAEGKTDTVTITRVIEAKKVTGVEFVAAPVAGTAYKYAVQQNNLGQTIYFTGEMSGYYMATSANPFDAVDVFVEDVDGGQRIYFNNADGVKTYVDVIPREDNPAKVNIVLTETPSCVFKWDAERKTFTTTVGENEWYIGCYSSYNTMSASATSYIKDPTVIGDSQFPSGFCTVNIVASQVAAPAADTAYKFAVVQNNLGQTLYFTGSMSGYYMATSVNPAEGVNVFVENVDGGNRLYFMKGAVKMYIDVIPREDNPAKVNIVLTETPSCVFKWDAERKTFTTTVGENEWYIGCYSTYNTMSASATSYIKDPTVIGDSQFPAGPYTVEGFMDMQPDLDKHEHTLADAVVENEKAATCTENGSYESVVYCTECKEEVTREKKTVAATGHTPAEAVQENLVGGGCGEAGSYEEVIKCTTCGEEISRTTVEIPATGDHNYITELERKDPTCTEAGYVKKACSCGAETTEELPAAHTPGEAAVENRVAPTLETAGSYEAVYTCTVCGADAGRETVEVPALANREVTIQCGGEYLTAVEFEYTSSSGKKKMEIELSDNKADAVKLMLRVNEDGTITFVTGDGLFLFADSTHVEYVDAEGEFTKFVLEETEGGYLIRCATANYAGKPQYLESWKGYLTVYSLSGDVAIFTFVIE